MSHKGASEGYGQTVLDHRRQQTPQYFLLPKKRSGGVRMAWWLEQRGPQKIAEVKRILGDKVDIYSPGVGAQGGAAETAMKAGANYLIVGREIMSSADLSRRRGHFVIQ